KKRRNTLFALEQSLFGDQTSQQQSYRPTTKKQKKKQKQPKEQGQIYDFGEAIQLQYNNEAFPTVTSKAESFSAPNFFASELEDESLPFTVEAFEVEEDVEPMTQPTTPQTQTDLEPEFEPEATSEPMEVQPVQTTVVPPSEMLSEPTRSVEQPTTVESNTAEAELSEDRAFAKDLQAVLNGQKTYDAEEKPTVPILSPKPPSVSPPHPHDIFDKGKTIAPSPQPIQPQPTPISRSHAVFDQMGQNMARATDFDQGTLDLALEQSFDEFDRLLDAEESSSDHDEQPVAQMMGVKDKPGKTKGRQKAEALEIGTTYTVCFSGTACTRDEGEKSRKGSDERIYSESTGYIPVRIHKEISGDENLREITKSSATVRGVGVNDWHNSGKKSEELKFDKLKVPSNLSSYVKSYLKNNQQSTIEKISGKSAVALALHGANLAVESEAGKCNFIGHSRGAVECIMAAWFLYAYSDQDIEVNIFAIDPVPGPGDWYGILTQLPPNVANYVGIYAWDELSAPLTPLVPRPNARMLGLDEEEFTLGKEWYSLANNYQLADPLTPKNKLPKKFSDLKPPENYLLYACRGKHSTVAGNTTADGQYNSKKLSENVEYVPKLVYQLARAYLSGWGTTFDEQYKNSAVTESVIQLKRHIHEFHRELDAMGGGETRTRSTTKLKLTNIKQYDVRRVSSISGKKPWNKYYLEDVAGDPPYNLAYPVTKDRKNAGWVEWEFL
ncbi:MAG: hypothetical protein AAFQ41_07200, partial [Cyanobacteria bacterium J06623_7]